MSLFPELPEGLAGKDLYNKYKALEHDIDEGDYNAIASELKRLFDEGLIKSGDKLDWLSELADVNPFHFREIFRQLKQEGHIVF